MERGADLHMVQLMPLPLTVSCFSKIQIGLPFWYRLTRVVPDKGPFERVYVCITHGPSVDVYTEADLGMFSMFGRTGAPQKVGRHKRTKKLPVSCCCNSSAHCSTGPQQNVDDDYTVRHACRPRQCRQKAVGEGGYGVFIY